MKSATLTFALLVSSWLATSAAAVSIGVQFRGGDGQNGEGNNSLSLLPSQVAGVVPQSNYNVMTGYNFVNNVDTTGNGYVNPSVLVDSNGNTTAMTITASGGGTYANGNAPGVIPTPNTVGGTADEILNSGLLNGRGTGDNTVTVNNIPVTYAKYDLYIYTSDDAARIESVSLAGHPTYWVDSPSARGGANYVDGNGATAYTYLQGTGLTSGTATPNATYVLYTGLSGSSLTFSTDVPGGNPFLNGFQIVVTQLTPEPSSFVLSGMALVGLVGYGWRRRRSNG